jgi:hypothetical protein
MTPEKRKESDTRRAKAERREDTRMAPALLTAGRPRRATTRTLVVGPPKRNGPRPLFLPKLRLRFATVAAPILTSCPECGRELQAVDSADAALGYRLLVAIDSPPTFPMAVAATMPILPPRPDQS